MLYLDRSYLLGGRSGVGKKNHDNLSELSKLSFLLNFEKKLCRLRIRAARKVHNS
jgi:hypothetical protein